MYNARFLIVSVLAMAGCNVFDKSLYLQRLDASVADAAAVQPLALADRCTSAIPQVTRTTGDYSIDTRPLANDLSDLATCAGRALPGNDGFFRVQMTAGDLWHFHVHTTGTTSNPAIYVLPDCEERSCTGGLDECGDGRDEHLSFRATETREYIIGVDSADTGGAAYTLTVLHPTCGNGVREHGESCEDHNVVPGDGCDEHCRSELHDGATEVEPNDDFSDPNVILPTGGLGTVTVQGRLGGRCDFDMFAVNVPAGASARATMLDVNGQECATSAPEFRMAWLLPDGHTTGGAGVTTMANHCPAITDAQTFAQHVTTAGMYYVRVTTGHDEPAALDYKIRFEVVGP